MNNNKLTILPESFFKMKSLGDIHLENNKLDIEVKNRLKKTFRSIPIYL